MNIQLLGKKKTPIILGITIPFIFWSLSEILPWMASGINRIGYRYTQNSSNNFSGRLTIIGKNSTERKYINDLKFPLSGKSDPRIVYDHFQLQLTGLIEVENPDIYWIGTESDDGSWIWIDGKKILDNRGLHSRQEKIDFVYLQERSHFIELKF
ncbi:MAG: hypothetical protein A2Y79_12915 [Deltaproteobacteria bacterium RBG_13_43_22]|nr:MAG: hypothetical protein A2Y79_12915 [Deltaproteobacteria bacterium RBG_13_43_22]